MTSEELTVSPVTSRARRAVATIFLVNGALISNLVPRFPQIKSALGLDYTHYGIAVAVLPIGSLVAGFAAAGLIRRFGSGKVAVIATIITGIVVLFTGVANSVAMFMLGLFMAGACDAITDVAQNAHGLLVQRGYGRSILNSFHAMWSIGAVIGGLMAAAAIALDIPLGVHLTISGILFTALSLNALRFTLPESDNSDEQIATDQVAADDPTSLDNQRRISPRLVFILAALTVIGISAITVESVGGSWAALYLTYLDSPAAIAASGFISMQFAQFIGRILGDRMVDRFGQRSVARAGGAITAVGMGIALAVPTIVGSVLGFAAAGFGIATVIPAAMQTADELPGLKRGTGLTIVTWLMRLGPLVSPPIIGLIADAANLRLALALTIPVAGLAIMLLSQVLAQSNEQAR